MKDSSVASPFCFQTYGRKYRYFPGDSPYFQGYLDALSKEWIIEASGNLQVIPNLTKEQYQELEFYGWTPPSQTPEEFRAQGYQPDITAASPNFVRLFEPNTDLEFLVEAIFTAMVGVYEINEDDFFNFGEGGTADYVDRLGLLGRVKSSDMNQNREIFALPGRNLRAIGD